MNFGPLIFLSAFFAMAISWYGMVLRPQVQLGALQQTNTLSGSALYPVARNGLAQQGLQVYRANGCAHCHSKNITQSGTDLHVILTEAGTNPPAFLAALQKVSPGLSEPKAQEFTAGLPKDVGIFAKRHEADEAIKTLNSSSAKAQLRIVPVGTDIARGWGKRRSVAEDYLFDSHVLLGYQRIGPDLSNIATRQPDQNWHLRHLYAPRSEVKKSTMPPYRFLFETRPIGREPSPDALKLTGEFAPEAGFEVVPRQEALALAAYLVSLQAEAPLFSAPLSVVSQAQPTADTNAPATSATTNAPAQ
jgi:cbb3-type cytochrome oxidase cytochrome c subunit